MSYIETAQKAVKDLEKMGASEAEAYIQKNSEMIISVQGGTWSKRKKEDTCIGIRTIKNKKKGFAAGTIPMCSLQKIEKASLTLCENNVADPGWEHLPYKKVYTYPEGIYDKKIAEMREEKVLHYVQELVNMKGDVHCMFQVVQVAIVNSHGVQGEYTGTGTDGVISQNGNTASAEWHSRSFKKIEDVIPEPRKVYKEISHLDHGFCGDALFLADALVFILAPCLQWLTDAENVYNGRTQFKKGDKIADSGVTVYDNGLLSGGIRSAPFDGEGNPMQETSIIEKGIFKNVLHSEYTAHKYNESSTGNALRSATREPTIGFSNVVVEPGEYSIQELIKKIDTGVLVKEFVGDVDPSGGYFNGRATGSYVKGGEIECDINHFHVKGNIFECLNQVVGMGKDQCCTHDGVYAVPILVSGVEIM
ncbi:MAG: TldD/PmbA family protein [Candidatus Methanofastidiosia archaeon]|jgi:PmbA protein